MSVSCGKIRAQSEEAAMQHFIDAVKSAVGQGNWYAALTLALTLPDVCGRLENPTMGSKQRYIQWWDKYLPPKYSSRFGPKKELHVFLSGEDAYALRCAYLHEGSDDVLNQNARKALEKFYFTVPPPRGNVVHCSQQGTFLQLQIDCFCQDICDGAAQWTADTATNNDVQSRKSLLLTIHDSPPEAIAKIES
jgi:hypothetical protein